MFGRWSHWCCAGLLLVLNVAAYADAKTAHEHYQRGRYEEAEAEWQSVLQSEPENLQAAIGLSRAHRSQGQLDEAEAVLKSALQRKADDPGLLAELADLSLERGRYEDAAAQAQTALKAAPEHPRARLIQARLAVENGQLQEADQGFVWFVRYYNRAQPTDAETLLVTAEGAAEYARWHSVSGIFNFIVNTLCPDAIKADPLSWQASFQSGSLLLEKYNRAQAVPDLRQALTINPRAAEVLTALGEAALQNHDLEEAERQSAQALKIRPNLVRALQLQADVLLTRGDSGAALKVLEDARRHHPRDQGTQGRLAACRYLLDAKAFSAEDEQRLVKLIESIDAIDDAAPEKPTALEAILIEVARRNPRPGRFLTTFASRLELRRRFELAEKLYLQAIRVMPQLSEPKTALGMLYMQTGRTDEAGRLLDAAFKSDPYHVRVSNMRKVLGVLGTYETVATDHFLIRIDKADRLLGEYMAEYLEETYAELTKLYGYEPPQRTTFEIYSDAKGLAAHQWFSARMVGLPWIQTIGASTGMMVALASPASAKQSYNWARVVRHEFVHVITLQQTKFNIPHWFTEALAVTAEGSERPAVWNQLLLERVPAGKLWSLDELNRVFVRPETPLDWQFAYCQSRLYAQYMIEKFGAGTLQKMLDAYRRGVSTKDAIPDVFGVSVEQFESGYRDFLKAIVSEAEGLVGPSSDKSIAILEKEHLAAPDDTAKAAAYAFALLEARRRTQARELASAVLKKNPKEPLAAVVLAELELITRNFDQAAVVLSAALDEDAPHARLLGLLARIRLLQKQPKEAARLYELGRSKLGIGRRVALPETEEWLKGLAAAYLQLGDDQKTREVLELIARQDADNLGARKKLAQLAIDRGDAPEALRWAREAVYIDVMDPEVHSALASAWAASGNADKAARERKIAAELESDR